MHVREVMTNKSVKRDQTTARALGSLRGHLSVIMKTMPPSRHYIRNILAAMSQDFYASVEISSIKVHILEEKTCGSI